MKFSDLLILKHIFCKISLFFTIFLLLLFSLSTIIFFFKSFKFELIRGLFIKGVLTCLNLVCSLFEKKSSGKNPFLFLTGVIEFLVWGIKLYIIYYLTKILLIF